MDVYCTKCKRHTRPTSTRVVELENQARALIGRCGVCGWDVYRILPEGSATTTPRQRPKLALVKGGTT